MALCKARSGMKNKDFVNCNQPIRRFASCIILTPLNALQMAVYDGFTNEIASACYQLRATARGIPVKVTRRSV
jgi:hypothetical protein